MAKLLVASEYTEPSAYSALIQAKLNEEVGKGKVGLLLITKDPGGCEGIVQFAADKGIPTVIHATITTLGGHTVEPNVKPYRMAIKEFGLLVAMLGDVDNAVLRIDPLIPEVTNMQNVAELVARASQFGVRRIRTSVIDYYPFVREKLKNLGLRYYNQLQAPLDVRADLLGGLMDVALHNFMTVESCAEGIEIDGLIKVGCASATEWARLGLEMQPVVHKQRVGCFCDIAKHDLLKGFSDCIYNCAYCYWHRDRN